MIGKSALLEVKLVEDSAGIAEDLLEKHKGEASSTIKLLLKKSEIAVIVANLL